MSRYLLFYICTDGIFEKLHLRSSWSFNKMLRKYNDDDDECLYFSMFTLYDCNNSARYCEQSVAELLSSYPNQSRHTLRWLPSG